MKTNEPTESKVERTLFKQICGRCGKEIKGTSRKQLSHTFDMHLMYCQRNKLYNREEKYKIYNKEEK